MLPRRLRSALAALGVLLALTTLAACGSDDDNGSAGEAGDLTTLKAGVSSIADLAPLYLGQRKGFFRDEGLRLDLKPQQGGAVTITGVISGDFDFGYSNTTSLLVANAKELPLVAIAPAAQVGKDPKDGDYTAIMVRRDSDIRTPADLAGRSVAANTLESQTDSTVKSALERRGIDTSNIRFTEIPFPDQVAALRAKRVDAITPIEPFVTLAKDAGFRTLLSGYFSNGIPNLTTGAYFTSKRFAEENKGDVERLRRAIDRSLEYAATHDRELRRIIPTFTSIKPALADRISLPLFRTTFDRAGLDRLAGQIQRYRLADTRPDVNALLGGSR